MERGDLYGPFQAAPFSVLLSPHKSRVYFLCKRRKSHRALDVQRERGTRSAVKKNTEKHRLETAADPRGGKSCPQHRFGSFSFSALARGGRRRRESGAEGGFGDVLVVAVAAARPRALVRCPCVSLGPPAPLRAQPGINNPASGHVMP